MLPSLPPLLLSVSYGLLRSWDLAADAAQSAGEDKQLFKHKTPPRQLQRAEIGGEVDVLIGIAGLYEPVSFPHGLGQDLRQQFSAAVEALADTLHHGPLIQSGAETVDRHDPPGNAVFHAFPFIDRIDHAAARALHFDLAVEDAAVPAVKIVFHVGLIKIGYVEFSALVHDAKTDQIQTPADAGELRRVGNEHRYAHALTVLGESDGLILTPVLVAPRKKGDQVIERIDAELVERLRLFLPDAFDITDVRL